MNNVDDELINALAKDLQKAFWQLVDYYQDRLYIFAVRLTGNSHDAEDIVQDALLGAYITLSNYPIERLQTLHLRSWLYKVVLNVFHNSKRGKHIQTQSIERFEELTGQAFEWEQPDKELPEQLIEHLEQRRELDALLMQLPVQYRIIITCYYFEELSYQEIAELTDQPLGTVKSRMHRGLRLIRQYIQAMPQNRRENHGVQ